MEHPNVLTRLWTIRETFRLRPNERSESNQDLQRFERLLRRASSTRVNP